jgi:hypothetical protein
MGTSPQNFSKLRGGCPVYRTGFARSWRPHDLLPPVPCSCSSRWGGLALPLCPPNTKEQKKWLNAIGLVGSSEAWGPSGTVQYEITQATTDPEAKQIVLMVLFMRLKEPPTSWRKVRPPPPQHFIDNYAPSCIPYPAPARPMRVCFHATGSMTAG